jgi:glycosyltransferase involved in cell wall biosynthesis
MNDTLAREMESFAMRELVILNFTMSKSHAVLSHQADVATLLAENFDRTTVITGDSSLDDSPEGMDVVSTNWAIGNKFSKIYRLFVVAVPILWKKRKSAVVFSHMTDLQSALLGPITRLLGIKHYLWYAHKVKSRFLLVANFFVNGIITSTPGSCPIHSVKVHPIGQAVDEKMFRRASALSNQDVFKALHVGRFDPSKDLNQIVSAISSLRAYYPRLEFTQIGSPSTPSASQDAEKLLKLWQSQISEGWLRFLPTINRDELPNAIARFQVFFHAYHGSLDKTLIEATMCGIPVISVNPEYISEFGTWSGSPENISLEDEFLSMKALAPEIYTKEMERRYRLCVERHSRAKWIDSLVVILGNRELTNGRRDS